MKDYKDIGEFITTERVKQGLTQQDLSNKINRLVSRISILQIEMGIQQTSVTKLSEIFKALGYNLSIIAIPINYNNTGE